MYAHGLTLSAFLYAATAFGQTTAAPPVSPAASASSFADEPYVVQRFTSITSMRADGTGTRVQTLALKIQSDAALRQYGVVSIAFATNSERADFDYVRVRRPDGTVLETSTADAREQPAPVTRLAPLYSDIQTKQLPVKSLRVGDTLEWQTTVTETHPEIAGQFWGQESFLSGVVVLAEAHELRVPAGLHATVWTNPHEKGSFSESLEKDQHVYRWRHDDLHPTVGAQAEKAKLAEEARMRDPDEELDTTKGKLPTLAWTTFPDYQAIGAWYQALSAGRAAPDAAIRSKVTELLAGKKTDVEKAQAIYNYVAMKIRYIGVDFGIGRYQPHTAAEVFANQYGDCKDKHTLLASMLSAAGFRADAVLIGAGIRFNPAVPSPASFNHLITRLDLDGQKVWLDSTAEVAPWEALVASIRDQEALVVPPNTAAVLARTPSALPYPAYATSAVVGSLDASLTSDSQMKLTFRDDDEIVIRAVLRNVSATDYGNFVQQFVRGLGYGGVTSDPVFEHLEDSSQPLTVSFHYHRVKEADWGENRITATFVPIALPSLTPQKPPTSSIELGTPRTETSTVEMSLPPGWNAELPEAVHAHAAFATCDVTYRLTSGKVFAERRLVVLQSEVSAADYKLYQKWYDDSGASGTPYIQLKPPAGSTAASASPKPEGSTQGAENSIPSSDPKAAELVKQAGESLRSMDLDAARKLLDEAKTINPAERGLWMGYGAIGSHLGKSKEAIQDLRQELAYFPDEVRIYQYLSMEKLKIGDSDGAIESLRGWVKAEPMSVQAARALVDQLEASKQYPQTISEAEAAIARIHPKPAETAALKLAAIHAQAASGHKEEAAAALLLLLKDAADPHQINNITYAMAEIGVDLPAAETAQRHALDLLDTQSAEWTLAEAPMIPLRKELSLAASWDTMAWVLYQEGKFEEALGYIQAALRLWDRPAPREHLTAIAAKLHSASAAAIARKSDQQFRTLPIGAANGRSGTAELRMLIMGGRAVSLAAPAANVSTAPGETEFKPGPTLTGVEALLKAADLKVLFPPDSHAHLVRSGSINCIARSCQLVLAPLSFDGN